MAKTRSGHLQDFVISKEEFPDQFLALCQRACELPYLESFLNYQIMHDMFEAIFCMVMVMTTYSSGLSAFTMGPDRSRKDYSDVCQRFFFLI